MDNSAVKDWFFILSSYSIVMENTHTPSTGLQMLHVIATQFSISTHKLRLYMVKLLLNQHLTKKALTLRCREIESISQIGKTDSQ